MDKGEYVIAWGAVCIVFWALVVVVIYLLS